MTGLGPSAPRELRAFERFLTAAERAIALIDRTRPLNLDPEMGRLAECFARGTGGAPAFSYAPAPDLTTTRRLLLALARRAEGLGDWGVLYGERALELELEAQAAEQVGSTQFRALAAKRFAVDCGPDGERASAWAGSWIERVDEAVDVRRYLSDDPREPFSLFSMMQKAVGERRLSFRVVISAGLSSAAATGDGVVLVKAGVCHSEADARRIVHHEIEGHVLPRHRAASESLGVFRVGTAQGSDDEEGRALLLEERAGHLSSARRLEVARRHLAALSVRHGASFAETAQLLSERGAPLRSALSLAARVHRGGGLGRELVYLSSLARVLRALALDPDVEDVLSRGRIGVAAVPRLRLLMTPKVLLRDPPSDGRESVALTGM